MFEGGILEGRWPNLNEKKENKSIWDLWETVRRRKNQPIQARYFGKTDTHSYLD